MQSEGSGANWKASLQKIVVHLRSMWPDAVKDDEALLIYFHQIPGVYGSLRPEIMCRGN